MLSKESKLRILENFISLDYLFFGKNIHEMNIELDTAKNYLETKGSLSSVLVELYTLIEHKPEEITKNLTENDMNELAKQSAITARSNTKNLLEKYEGKSQVIESVFNYLKENENIDSNDIVNYKIQEKAFQLGMDNMLLARSLSESTNPSIMESIEGQIIGDTYKNLRDSLIEHSLGILTNQ